MGIIAWVLYSNGNQFKFAELTGTGSYNSTNPEDWGLPKNYTINLVLQQGSFIQAWVDGDEVRKW